MVAYRKVCSRFGNFPILGLGLVAMLLCLADARPLAAEDGSRSGAAASSDSSSPSQSSIPAASFVITSTLNLLTGEVVLQESHARPDARPQAAQQQQRPEIIERIDFIGNRRARNDTPKTRVFPRENHAYKVETLRRGFQVLLNSPFLGDVKRRVEESTGPSHAE